MCSNCRDLADPAGPRLTELPMSVSNLTVPDAQLEIQLRRDWIRS